MRDDSGSNRAKIRGQYIYTELPLLETGHSYRAL